MSMKEKGNSVCVCVSQESESRGHVGFEVSISYTIGDIQKTII